ncbi:MULTISPECIES: HNH endonuclease [Microbacterium]|uniref:HNH endonuclease n=1 Tax=Microbacterium TaxID=33882 RepID=UPI0033900CC7
MCGKVLRRGLRRGHPDGPSLDHKIPAKQGGTWDLWNLLPACYGCNSGRRDRPIPARRGMRSRNWGGRGDT